MKSPLIVAAWFTLTVTTAHAQQQTPDKVQGCPFPFSVQQVDDFVEHHYNDLAGAEQFALAELQDASKNATKPSVAIGLQMTPQEMQRFSTARHSLIGMQVEELKFSKLDRDVHVIAEVLAVAKLADLYEVKQGDLQRDDPRQFYFKILLMLRANEPKVSQTPRVDFGIDCDPEAGLFWEEDFALHQLAKGGAPDAHLNNLVSDIERIRALYQLCWKLFNHGIEDIHATRWSGEEAHTPDSISPMIDGSNEVTKRIYSIVIAYIDAQMPSEREFQAKYQQRISDEANRKFPTKQQ